MSKKNASPTTAPQQEPTLDQAVSRLEAIVRELESGSANLERSIELFAEGKKLSATALGKLNVLERKVQMVVNTDGAELDLVNFGDSRSDEESP